MRGKAFFKKVESDPDLFWRGAKIEPAAEDAFVRISSKRTGATYQISGAAVKRLTAKEIDAMIAGRMPEDCTGVNRAMITGNMVFPWAWSAATCLGVCVAKYAAPAKVEVEETSDADPSEKCDAKDGEDADDEASGEDAEANADEAAEVAANELTEDTEATMSERAGG